MTLTDLKIHNTQWFARGNKKFFGDVSYRVMHSKKTGEPYLVRSTYMWSDMFGQPKKLVYRINHIGRPNAKYKIGSLLDDIFPSFGSVKEWLKNN